MFRGLLCQFEAYPGFSCAIEGLVMTRSLGGGKFGCLHELASVLHGMSLCVRHLWPCAVFENKDKVDEI